MDTSLAGAGKCPQIQQILLAELVSCGFETRAVASQSHVQRYECARPRHPWLRDEERLRLKLADALRTWVGRPRGGEKIAHISRDRGVLRA